ncbi:hypothetical protein EW146_g7026 [Bondarzewia mesenterica]|uniref:TBP-associated factor 12 n=1 Tax=Bondarzewia mesenterica TaxID=1095465 RepID=A0A4S4LLX4_9AGAM|nr:hypothetical protein EW146_g7026 [Bondarzewia mesenterica]
MLQPSGLVGQTRIPPRLGQLVLKIHRAVWEETQRRISAVHAPAALPAESRCPWNRSIRERGRELVRTGALFDFCTRNLTFSFNSALALGEPLIAFAIAKRLILRHWLLIFGETQLLVRCWRTCGRDSGEWAALSSVAKNGVQRHRLEPFVEALEVRAGDGNARTRHTYEQEEVFERQLEKLSGGSVSVLGLRGLPQFGFELSHRSHNGDPNTESFRQEPRAALYLAHRLLIDALYGARCEVICLAEADPEHLFFPDALKRTRKERGRQCRRCDDGGVDCRDAGYISLKRIIVLCTGYGVGVGDAFCTPCAGDSIHIFGSHGDTRWMSKKPHPPKASADEAGDFAVRAEYAIPISFMDRPEAPRIRQLHVRGIERDDGAAFGRGRTSEEGSGTWRVRAWIIAIRAHADDHLRHTMATNGAQPNQANSIITALGNAFKSQTGDPLPGDRIAQLLLQNMGQLGELAKQGKLNQQQIMQLKEYADKHKAATMAAAGTPVASGSQAGGTSSSAQAGPSKAATLGPPHAAFKGTSPTPLLSSAPSSQDAYPISQTVSAPSTAAVSWPLATQGRPTLTGGTAAGRVAGTPVLMKPTTEEVFTADDTRSRRKSTPGDQSMRRSIQDLVSSLDPNVKIEPEVEDLLLDIADEFIDSVTNFGCRLAKHRGGDTLEVRDLQLHLERNHNIRIPGFSSDETRITLSQPGIAPPAPAGVAKKGAQGSQMTLRSHRLAQVQQAKREAKLI